MKFIKLTADVQFPDGIYFFKFKDSSDTITRLRYGDEWLHRVVIDNNELFELFDAYSYKPFKRGKISKN